MAFLVGCRGGDDAPAGSTPFDPDSARSALVESLDAWKKGEARSLAKRRPPIRMADDDLAEGYRLADYEIEEPDAPIEANRDVAVILSLRDAKGNVLRREARYQVATTPSLAVLRSDR